MPKETALSGLERRFVTEAIAQELRVDGRSFEQYRKLAISFGKRWGHAEVTLGDSRAIAQTSCEVVEPAEGRPTEGTINYNVELSPMASPGFEAGRPSPRGIEVQRVLERGLKECRAVDCESLCIVAGERVWAVRVNIHVLNNAGNLVDLAALAALASVVHFKRPHVDVIGDEVTIHPVTDHAPDPLSVHHRPVCVTFAHFAESGGALLVDPTAQEEAVSSGTITVAVNAHREICALHKLGGAALDTAELMECVRAATDRAAELSETLATALAADQEARAAPGRGPSLKKLKLIKEASAPAESVPVPDADAGSAAAAEGEHEEYRPSTITQKPGGTAEAFTGVAGWDLSDDSADERPPG